MNVSIIGFAHSQAIEGELVNTMNRSKVLAVDANFESEYEGGLLFTANHVLAELGEKIKGGTCNGLSGQIANSYAQCVVSSMFVSLLFAREESIKWLMNLFHLLNICRLATLNMAYDDLTEQNSHA